MSTTPIAVIYNGATVNVTAPVSGLTAAALIALIPSSFYGGVAVRLTTQTAPTTLIAASTSLISTYSITVGTVYTFNLVAVARYAVTNSNDTNPLTNQVNIDYLPGTTYMVGSLPTRQTVIADTVTAINVLKVANSLSTIAAPNTVGVNNDNAAGWYGFYTTSSNTILESTFIAAGTYLFSPVSHYTIAIPHGTNVLVEALTTQTAGALLAATGIPSQSNPFPALFVNDGTVTDATVQAKIINASTTVAPLGVLVSYIAMIVNQYTVIQPAVVAGVQTPIYNTPYPFSAVSTPDLVGFSVMGATGITNTTGATVITGLFGSNPTATITMSAGTINGSGAPSSTSSANAHTQALALYTYLQTTMSSNVSFGSTSIGTQALTAGIYSTGSSMSFSGTITLNGQNNPNSIWIFQSTTIAFGSTTFTLTNSAQAGNVFFVANGAVSMSGAAIKGTVISNAAITDSGSSTIVGRLISTASNVILNTSTVNIPATPTNTITVTAAAAVTTIIDTLEFQTPLYLLGALSPAVSSATNGLTVNAPGAPLLNNLLPVSPMQSLQVCPIVSFSIFGASTTATVRGTYTETVGTLLQDPSLAPMFVGIPAGKQITLYQNTAYTVAVSPSIQLQNVQSTWLYTNVANALGFNSITVNLPGSSMAPFQLNFSNDSTYGDSYTNVRAAAMSYFGSLVDSSTTKYCLFDATNPLVPGNPYGPWSVNSTGVSATLVGSTDPVVFNLVSLTTGQLAVSGGTTGVAYFPSSFTCGQTVKYLTSSGAQGMSTATAGSLWVLFSGSSDPFMPWQSLITMSPTLNLSARQDVGIEVDLITDNQGTSALTLVSQNHVGSQFIAWAQFLYPALATQTLSACIKLAAGNIPIFQVLGAEVIFPSPNASPTHNALYIKNSTEVVLVPPTSVIRPNVDTTLPTSFTMYDLLNYAKTNFGLTTLLAYALYPVADPNQNVLGPLDTVSSIISEFSIVGAAKFQLIPASYAQVSVVYNGNTTVLQAMPVSSLISEVLLSASISLNITAPALLELVSTTIQMSDPISKWATAPTSTGGLYTLTLNLETQVKANVVLYSSNGFVVWTKKESLNMTVSQLIAAYMAANKIAPATLVTLTSLTTGAAANLSAILSTYSRSISGAADIANLDPTDSTPVTKVVEFTEVQVVQTMTLNIQNLFNVGAAASLVVPQFATAAFVTKSVVSQFGYDVSSPTATFGLAVVGTVTPVASNSATSASNTYILVETDLPLQWANVKIGYTDQTKTAMSCVVLASTPLSKLSGFDARMDILSLSNGGASLSPYTQTVASLMNASGLLQLYDSTLPNVSVTASLNGTVKIISISPRSLMSDVVAALGVAASQPVTITEVSSGKSANLTDLLVSFTAPFSFTIVNAPLTYKVTFTFGTQSASKNYANGTLVSAMTSDVVTLLSLDATKSYSLYIAGQASALAPSAAPDLTSVTSFTVVISPALDSNSLIALSSVGALSVLAAILFFTS